MTEIVTSKSTRRCTRLRVEIPVTVTSLDRRHAFVAECVAILVSPQGAGLQAPQALPVETPIMLNGLPGGASTSARVASCLPLGSDGRRFLIGISLYNPDNVWGIADPPEDWECAPSAVPDATATSAAQTTSANTAGTHVPRNKPGNKNVWPYNIFSGHTEAHPGRR